MHQWRCVFLLLGLLVLAASCEQAGVQTYPVTAQQVQEMRMIAGIPPCPSGQTHVAMAVTLATGGGTISVRCDVGNVLK